MRSCHSRTLKKEKKQQKIDTDKEHERQIQRNLNCTYNIDLEFNFLPIVTA